MFYWNKLDLQCCVCYMCTESCSVTAIPILTHVCLFLAVLGLHRRRLSLVAGSGCDPSQLRLAGSSCCGAQALGPRASVASAHGLSCSAAYGIFPDQGSNSCPPCWQQDSYPLYHHGSPGFSDKG